MNKLSQEQLQEMVHLQVELNKVMWKDTNVSEIKPHVAVIVELIEMLNHAGWEWWKNPNKKYDPTKALNDTTFVALNQARMEFVDVIHFIISQMQIHTEVGASELERSVLTQFGVFMDRIHATVKEQDKVLDIMGEMERDIFINCVMSLISFFTRNPNYISDHYSIACFAYIIRYLKMEELVYPMYIGKNALNHFRQSMGEKTANCTYTRIWSDGREDNEHLMEIIIAAKSVDTSSLDLLEYYLDQLSQQYSKYRV
jgi:hypothetical protein